MSPVKRTTDGHVEGAKVRVQAKRPACPLHHLKMAYDPDDGRWHCTWAEGCVITVFQKGDVVQTTSAKHTGPVSVVIDKRDGKVWLRLAPSSWTGDAQMVLLAEDFTRLESTVGGVAAQDPQTTYKGARTASFSVSDVVEIDHTGRLRR